MCNFSLDGPRPPGDPSCCRRVGTACPPHSVFPPPALMSPFHYCATIHHAHGQGDFASTCVCGVCGEMGPRPSSLVTRHKPGHLWARALDDTCPKFQAYGLRWQPDWTPAPVQPQPVERVPLWFPGALASSLRPDTPERMSCFPQP